MSAQSPRDRPRSWLRRRGRGASAHPTEQRPTGESDVAADHGLARSRAHGGPQQRFPDGGEAVRPGRAEDGVSTTGTAANGLFVGRVAGDDLGYAELTGAEVRSAQARPDPHDARPPAMTDHGPAAPDPEDPTTGTSRPVRLSRWHRGVGLLLGTALIVFGVLGFLRRLGFFATSGPPVLGLSTNGLLSTLSLVFGAVLIAAAARGGRIASTTSVVVGALFMASGVLNVLVLATPYNLLSFRMPNVIFSLVAGGLLLVLGAYGRFTGRLPAENPYRRSQVAGPIDAQRSADVDQQLPADPDDVAAARDLTTAERDAAAGVPDARRQRILDDVDTVRDGARRRAVWRGRDG